MQPATKEMFFNKVAGSNIAVIIVRKCGLFFPDSSDMSNITPLRKKDLSTDKENNKPISIVFDVYRIHEILIYEMLGEFIATYFNVLFCRFS